MRRVEVEQWALRVIDAVVKGTSTEDDRVEMKAQWPEDADFARKFAAHANSARGDSIIWLIGVDEKGHRVVGAEGKNYADWWPQVETHCASEAPRTQFWNVTADGHDGTPKNVVVLHAETDAAPYLVRNPHFGASGVKVSSEVPWRSRTSTRTATREDLLRMLVPSIKMPTFELHRMRAECTTTTDGRLRIGVEGSLYLVHLSGGRLHIPDYMARGIVNSVDGGQMIVTSAKLEPQMVLTHTRGMSPESANDMFLRTRQDLAAMGPGMLNITANAEVPVGTTNGTFGLNGAVEVEIYFKILGLDPLLVVRATLWPAEKMPTILAAWEWSYVKQLDPPTP